MCLWRTLSNRMPSGSFINTGLPGGEETDAEFTRDVLSVAGSREVLEDAQKTLDAQTQASPGRVKQV